MDMKRFLSPFLIAPALTCALLAACGPETPVPADLCAPDTASSAPGSATICGTVLLPVVAGAVASQSLNTQGLNTQGIRSIGNWNAPHVPGEVLIISEGALTPLPGILGSLSLQDTGINNVQQVKTPAGETDQAFAERLTKELTTQGLKAQGVATGAAVFVQPNYIYSALNTPNDPGYPTNPAGVKVNGVAYDQDYLLRINAAAGWDLSTTGAVTAVIDTGIDLNHPEFRGRLLQGKDFAFNDDDPSEATGGDIGHGTSSAGLIGALGNNGVGITGLTWSGQNILPLKVFDNKGGASTADLARAVDFAVIRGVKVVNMSLGVVGVNIDMVLAASLKSAADAGLVLVAAAGNTANDGLYYPAADPNVLAVGALGQTDDLASYSARPKSGQKALDLVAPGGTTSSGFGILSLAPTNQGSYRLLAGTSEAAPLVSGGVALLRSFRPELDAVQVKTILSTSAKTVAGGKLLNVGAALNLAACLPQNVVRPYTLKINNGITEKTYTGSLPANVKSVPYTATKLPNGSRTITAILKVGGGTCAGTLQLNVTGNVVNQNIQVR
jgi:subtilisin family serine protease